LLLLLLLLLILPDDPDSSIENIQDLLAQERGGEEINRCCDTCGGNKPHEKIGEAMHFEDEERHLCLHLKPFTKDKKIYNVVKFPNDTFY
jgi:hypothetical protein